MIETSQRAEKRNIVKTERSSTNFTNLLQKHLQRHWCQQFCLGPAMEQDMLLYREGLKQNCVTIHTDI